MKHSLSKLLVGVTAGLMAFAPLGSHAMDRAEFDVKMAQINHEAGALQGERPSNVGAAVGVDFDVTWKQQDLSFDLPSVSMREQVWYMKIPEFGWDLVDVGFGVKMHLPTVTMREQRWVMQIPETRLERDNISLHLPEFVAKNTRVQIGEMQDKAKSLAGRAKALQEQFLSDQRRKAINQIDGVIQGLQTMIDHAAATQGDAAALKAQLQQVVQQRAAVLSGFDSALKKL